LKLEGWPTQESQLLRYFHKSFKRDFELLVELNGQMKYLKFVNCIYEIIRKHILIGIRIRVAHILDDILLHNYTILIRVQHVKDKSNQQLGIEEAEHGNTIKPLLKK
jgi:CRISPR/Cas system-associated endonuclease Cas3-HD